MTTYKEVQNRQWFDKLYSLDYADQPYSLVDVDIDIQHLNTAILDWMMMIEDNGQFDNFLLMEFKEQFGDWLKELFSASDGKIRKAMKERLRSCGVYLPLNARDTITEQLYSMLSLDTCPLWPEKELNLAMIDPNFNLTSARTFTAVWLHRDLYDVFNLKLNIFNDLCTKARVTTEQYPAAFGTMLRGKAQTYYYQHLAGKTLTFLELCDRTRAYFHTAENHQHFLNEWRSIMLRDIITANLDKSLPQCLEITIERLQRTYLGLSQNYGATNETNLAGQLVSVCQGVPV
ncbi:hypothetical protein EK21DRAFT_108240 [Setomelanomma holmii]|uniref:Uncharacterized protein n=1 Tax=Setomelanomma holmii TaxID=210430 RepID=A0A9P4LRC5_9PLEO|nr:hypothetical protein EK21DRAFT_108240 [Setomelanomma holmii]